MYFTILYLQRVPKSFRTFKRWGYYVAAKIVGITPKQKATAYAVAFLFNLTKQF